MLVDIDTFSVPFFSFSKVSLNSVGLSNAAIRLMMTGIRLKSFVTKLDSLVCHSYLIISESKSIE